LDHLAATFFDGGEGTDQFYAGKGDDTIFAADGNATEWIDGGRGEDVGQCDEGEKMISVVGY
jgi:Ca2+-binding RTX toxin-like protein